MNIRSKKDLYVLDLPAAVRSSATIYFGRLASKSLHSQCQSARRQLKTERRNWFHEVSTAKCRTTTLMEWWSQTGSNRRPEACKATALPTELWPRLTHFTEAKIQRPSLNLVGLGRLELPTSRLSSARSNQLSYKPGTGSPRHQNPSAQCCDLERKRNVDGGVPQMGL
jgi:hypothetical protein